MKITTLATLATFLNHCADGGDEIEILSIPGNGNRGSIVRADLTAAGLMLSVMTGDLDGDEMDEGEELDVLITSLDQFAGMIDATDRRRCFGIW